LVGATGRTGNWILKTALTRGHHVTALVRPPLTRLPSNEALLSVVAGDVLESADLVERLAGHDAIVSALNSATVAEGTRRLVAAAEKAGVPRFLGVAGGGILQLDANRLRRERPGYPEMFVRSSARHLEAWQTLAASSLQWTLACAPDLLDAPAGGLAKIEADYMPEGGRSIPAGDVAEFLIAELERPRFTNLRVGMTV